MSAWLRGKLRRKFDKFFLRRLAFFNRPYRTFYLQHRPDFDLAYGRFAPSGPLHAAWVRGMEANNWGDLNRLYFLYLNLQRLLRAGVQGDLAELGVFRGNSAKLLHQLAPDRELWLFDTFAGFDDADVSAEATAVKRRDFADTSLAAVRSFVGDSERVHYVEGRFPDTAAALPEGRRFAFVHLDCDLYQPIRAGLEHFYPRLARGGLMVIHDYGSGHWPGVAQAVDEFLAGKPETLLLVPDKSGTAVFAKV
jgi:hypothetical protein